MTETVRIDKWLWAGRFFKTRSLATAAVDSGKIRLNDEPVKPARHLHIGDRLHIDNSAGQWEVVILKLSEVRGSATVAQTLYAETPHSIAKHQKEAEQKKFYREPGTTLKGRPTKRDRRLLDKAHTE